MHISLQEAHHSKYHTSIQCCAFYHPQVCSQHIVKLFLTIAMFILHLPYARSVPIFISRNFDFRTW